MKKPRIRRRLKEYSPRDLLIVGLPLLIVVIAGFWLASRYIRPAPPDTLIISTGGEGGAYQRFGAAYKDVLTRYGIQVTEEASAGSTENLERLRDAGHAVDAAFVQGGTARLQEDDALVSLGSLYNEPLWIFYRTELESEERPLTRISELKGKRICKPTRSTPPTPNCLSRVAPAWRRPLRQSASTQLSSSGHHNPQRCGHCCTLPGSN